MNRITKLFGIKYPIIQGGMIWCSGWKLASAVSNSGGLGLIGSGSMYPEVLRQHIKKCKLATNNPFGVNIPLLYPNLEEHIKAWVLYDNQVKAYNDKVKEIRNKKNSLGENIVEYMKRNHPKHSTIEISDGKLKIATTNIQTQQQIYSNNNTNNETATTNM